MRFVWTICGLLSLTLGTLGVVLPLLPTVPFLLLAAFCFAKGSDRLHHWLLSHRIFGPPIEEWRTKGAISRVAKRWSTVSILAVLAMSFLLNVAWPVFGLQIIILTAVLTFIWTRPNS
ncbi:YbaN family protein [Cognatishimia sp. SS12]|uniref:YbaN family protein n=1 Tax=Cognatishimia sp. SS12 TaxID=2979465 RepID=UPI00232BD2C1|nr:YbaN family protein [Cognatishimia sp. SS12]MDC0737734.1 YbaN family protein [Cognatishimia sp. SS12]